MADNKLELAVEVDVNKANASIKGINTGLSSMEQAAGKAARGASAGIDGLTVSMVKGSAAGNLLADSIKKALDWAKEWTLGAAQHAAHTDKMSLSMAALAKAHGVSAEASNRAVEAVKKVGFGTQDAIHAVDRLMVADMNLSKAEGLAKVAKDVLKGEPGILHGRGFLSADGRRGHDLLFHPFRLHVMERSVSVGDHITLARAKEWNSAAELAILLEPIYWPEITSHMRYNLGERDHSARLTSYRRKAIKLVRGLDPDVWRKIHEALRIDAAWMDPNGELYILLRLSLWAQREALRGRISGALWIRHMAEVIRRGFEEAHDVHWPEEDRAFGHWIPGARLRLFGAERPYDDPLQSKTFVAYHFGLFTGSALRWYVEGETEYYAISHALQQPSKLGVELVNLRGEIATEKRNAARKLEDALKEDLALRRLSVISFDRDLEPNVRAIRRQVEQGHVVGLIEANNPDFEFANFSLEELIEIAALMDDREHLNGSMIRQSTAR